MPKIQHIHTLIRAKVVDKNTWFMCAHINCRYRERKAFLLGKLAMCNCSQAFQLTATSLQRARPTCPNCVEDKKEKRRQEKEIMQKTEISNIVGDLFNG